MKSNYMIGVEEVSAESFRSRDAEERRERGESARFYGGTDGSLCGGWY